MNWNQDCGCRHIYPFPQASCNGNRWQGPSGPFPCHPHFPSLARTFTIPEVDVAVRVEVTDTETLTTGQGILIGDAFFIIDDVIDATRLDLKHNGLGAVPGTILTAINRDSGCFNYPIIPAGKVSLDTGCSLVGLEADGETEIVDCIVSVQVNRLVYGYIGPTSIQVQADIQVELANTPAWVGVSLPVIRRTAPPDLVFAAYIVDGGDPQMALAKGGGGSFIDYAIVGPGDGDIWTDGEDKQIVFSGIYEV